METVLKDCGAGLIAVGHYHRPLVIRLGPWHVINTGGVSNPDTDDLRAGYALLEAGPAGYTITQRSVAYDWVAVIDQLEAVNHRGREFIAGHWLRLNGD